MRHADAPEDSLEAGIGVQRPQGGIHTDLRQRRAVLDGLVQPFERGLMLAERRVDYGDVVCGHVTLARQRQESVALAASLVDPSGGGQRDSHVCVRPWSGCLAALERLDRFVEASLSEQGSAKHAACVREFRVQLDSTPGLLFTRLVLPCEYQQESLIRRRRRPYWLELARDRHLG